MSREDSEKKKAGKQKYREAGTTELGFIVESLFLSFSHTTTRKTTQLSTREPCGYRLCVPDTRIP